MTKKDRPRKRIHIYLYPDTQQAVQQCAKEELRSFSAVVEAACRLYLDMKQYRDDPVKMMRERRKLEQE